MTRYMNFMRHKPWEPTNFANQERLFKAEQAVEHEKKQALLLVKEREKERELERIRELNRKNNFIVVRETEENEEEEEVPFIPQAVAANTLEEYLAKKKELEAANLAALQAADPQAAAELMVSEDTDSIGWEACESDVVSDSSSDSSSDSEANKKKKRKKSKKHKHKDSAQELSQNAQPDAIGQARKEQHDALKMFFQAKYAAVLKDEKKHKKQKKHKKDKE